MSALAPVLWKWTLDEFFRSLFQPRRLSSQFGQRASARRNQPFPIDLPVSCPFNGTAEAVPFQIEHSIQSPRRPDLGFCDHMRRTARACLSAASAIKGLSSRAQKKEAGPEEHLVGRPMKARPRIEFAPRKS